MKTMKWNIGDSPTSQAKQLDAALQRVLYAAYSGICPLCSKYIAKTNSRIVHLPIPLAPRGDGIRSSDDGGIYNARGGRISLHPRKFAHYKCAKRYVRELEDESA